MMKFSSLAGGSKHYHQTSVKVRYHSLWFFQMILYTAFRHFSHTHLWKTHRGPSEDLQVSFWAVLPSVPQTGLSPQPLSSVSSTEGGHQALRVPFSEPKPINSLKTVSWRNIWAFPICFPFLRESGTTIFHCLLASVLNTIVSCISLIFYCFRWKCIQEWVNSIVQILYIPIKRSIFRSGPWPPLGSQAGNAVTRAVTIITGRIKGVLSSADRGHLEACACFPLDFDLCLSSLLTLICLCIITNYGNNHEQNKFWVL